MFSTDFPLFTSKLKTVVTTLHHAYMQPNDIFNELWLLSHETFFSRPDSISSQSMSIYTIYEQHARGRTYPSRIGKLWKRPVNKPIVNNSCLSIIPSLRVRVSRRTEHLKVQPVDIYGGQDCDNDPCKRSPEVGQDLADVVAASAKHGEDGITECAFQRTTGQAAISFHVTNLSLEGASVTQVGETARSESRSAMRYLQFPATAAVQSRHPGDRI